MKETLATLSHRFDDRYGDCTRLTSTRCSERAYLVCAVDNFSKGNGGSARANGGTIQGVHRRSVATVLTNGPRYFACRPVKTSYPNCTRYGHYETTSQGTVITTFSTASEYCRINYCNAIGLDCGQRAFIFVGAFGGRKCSRSTSMVYRYCAKTHCSRPRRGHHFLSHTETEPV